MPGGIERLADAEAVHPLAAAVVGQRLDRQRIARERKQLQLVVAVDGEHHLAPVVGEGHLGALLRNGHLVGNLRTLEVDRRQSVQVGLQLRRAAVAPRLDGQLNVGVDDVAAQRYGVDRIAADFRREALLEGAGLAVDERLDAEGQLGRRLLVQQGDGGRADGEGAVGTNLHLAGRRPSGGCHLLPGEEVGLPGGGGEEQPLDGRLARHQNPQVEAGIAASERYGQRGRAGGKAAQLDGTGEVAGLRSVTRQDAPREPFLLGEPLFGRADGLRPGVGHQIEAARELPELQGKAVACGRQPLEACAQPSLLEQVGVEPVDRLFALCGLSSVGECLELRAELPNAGAGCCRPVVGRRAGVERAADKRKCRDEAYEGVA